MTSVVISLCVCSEVQCYEKSSYPLKHLLKFSWGRDVVDVKGCLSSYQKMRQGLWFLVSTTPYGDATVSFLTFENIVPHTKKNPRKQTNQTQNNQQANNKQKKNT